MEFYQPLSKDNFTVINSFKRNGDKWTTVKGETQELIRKKTLERTLEKLRPHPNPEVALEQYTIPAELAAEILFTAAYTYDDIQGRDVVDLGCGTGRLAIGVLLLDAERAIGVDIDAEAISVAKANAESLRVSEAEWIISDIDALRGRFHTTVMNPPFGTRIRHQDRRFLEKALELSEVVYSIHKRTTRRYLLRLIESKGAKVEALLPRSLLIPWMFEFHRKPKRGIEVDVYRIITKTSTVKTP